MPEAFLNLSAADRHEALAVAAAASGRPVHLLDKDVWLVWLLDVLFRSPFGEHLVFKGGSSMSKGYQIISRFSEDVDLTYDIRALAPDLSGPGLDPLPTTRSQEKRWTKKIRSRLPVWITEQVMPRVSAALADYLPRRLAVHVPVFPRRFANPARHARSLSSPQLSANRMAVPNRAARWRRTLS